MLEEYLEDYERGSDSFAEYIAETLSENFYDVDLIEHSTEKYDHKRGFCTLTAEVNVPIGNLLATKPYISSEWVVSVQTPAGRLTLD